MIKRIRIEAEADTRERVTAELDTASQRSILAIGGGPWECMDDVVTAIKNSKTLQIDGYQGRRVYHYRGERNNA